MLLTIRRQRYELFRRRESGGDTVEFGGFWDEPVMPLIIMALLNLSAAAVVSLFLTASAIKTAAKQTACCISRHIER